MTEKSFFWQLSLTVLTAVVLLGIIDFFFSSTSQWPVGLGLIIALIAITLAIFYTSKKAAKNPKPDAYIRNFISFTAIKIFVLLLFVIIYKSAVQNVDKAFIFTFLIIYTIFMVFETYVFMKISKS